MSAKSQRYLAVVDGRSGPWRIQVDRQLQLGNNFLIILPQDPTLQCEFCGVLGLQDGSRPQPLSPADLFLLSPYFSPAGFEILRYAWETRNDVFFIEAIQLPANRPPRTKQFVVYCTARGIISHHARYADAVHACARHLRQFARLQQYAETSVYEWRSHPVNGDRWVKRTAIPEIALDPAIQDIRL